MDSEFKELKNLYEIEKQKWIHLSSSLETSLTFDQFYQFIYTEEFPNIREFEESITFNVYDQDKNGYLSVDEFMENSRSKN